MDADGDLDIMVLDNFLAGWFTGFPAGIYYLENKGGDITDKLNWDIKTIYRGYTTQEGRSSYHRARFLDVDGDGKGAVYYYESQGKSGGKLQYKRAALYKDPACMPGDAQIVDIDGDGQLEIVQVIYDTSVAKDSSSSSIFIYKLKP